MGHRKSVMMLLAVILLLIGCKPKVPKGCIQPRKMEKLLYDYHLSQAMARQISDGTNRNYNSQVYLEAVLNKYDVTEAEFDSSLVYYYSHADEFKKIYEKVNKRLNDQAVSLGAAVGGMGEYAQYTTTGDTANIWKDATTTLLLPQPPYNRMEFVIPADTSFHQGDAFLFQFLADFIYQSGTKDAVGCLNVKYVNDSVSTIYTHISVNGLSQMRVAKCNKPIKEIRGFIYLDRGNDDTNTLKLMNIHHLQFIRFHDKTEENRITKEQ